MFSLSSSLALPTPFNYKHYLVYISKSFAAGNDFAVLETFIKKTNQNFHCPVTNEYLVQSIPLLNYVLVSK